MAMPRLVDPPDGRPSPKRSMHDELEAGIQLLSRQDADAVIGFGMLEDCIGCTRRGQPARFRAYCGRLKKLALERLRITLKAEINIGYRILTASRQVTESTSVAKGAGRRLKLAKKIADAVDRQQLNAVEQQRADWIATRMGLMADAVSADVSAMRKLTLGKTPTNPWLPPPQKE